MVINLLVDFSATIDRQLQVGRQRIHD
jgi:hypothetical protein